MHLSHTSRLAIAAAAVALLGACDRTDAVGPKLEPEFSSAGLNTPGAVYTMTNAADGNAVAVFTRSGEGTLEPAGSWATGGLGNGGDLGNQGSIVVSRNHQFLFVVNAGSDDISSFAIRPGALELVSRVSSGGMQPVSVATYQDLVYVVNAGGKGSIMGFRVGEDGSLAPVSGSSMPLSGADAPGPAQIAFSRDGRFLAVSEKATNLIDIYTLNRDATPSGPMAQPSAGETPFGLGFGLRDQLIVSEAFGGAAGLASASSYHVARDGTLDVITPALGNTQTAACWAAVTPNGRLTFTANTPSNTISGYWIAPDGSLSLVDQDGVTGMSNAGDLPKDIAFSHNGRYLYALNSGAGSVGVFVIGDDGSLTHLQDSDAVLPAGVVNGIAAW